MDFVNKLTGGNKPEGQQAGNQDQQQQQQSSGGGFMDKLNSLAGGGRESEKNEDTLDKGRSRSHRSANNAMFCTSLKLWLTMLIIGVDWVQEHVLGQGDQSNESAAEQAKDEQISDFIRGQYKKTTGSDVPIKDKERF